MGVSSIFLPLRTWITYYLWNITHMSLFMKCWSSFFKAAYFFHEIENRRLKFLVIFEKSESLPFLLWFQSQLLYTTTCVCLMHTHCQEQQAWSVIKNETAKYLCVLLTLIIAFWFFSSYVSSCLDIPKWIHM